MEMQLQNIIDKIKKEGVEQAKSESDKLIKEAQAKAKSIIQEAENKKQEILKSAEKETLNFKNNAQDSLKQTLRDTLLALREKITGLFDVVVKREIRSALTPEVVSGMVLKIVENFKKDKEIKLEILLSAEDKQKIEELALGSLSQELKKDIVFKVSHSLNKGFRIGVKDGNSYYDFSDEALLEAFTNYLNPKLVEILTKEKRDGQ